MSLIPRSNLLGIDRFFDDFWAPSVIDNELSSFFSPRVDIADEGDHYEITAELPGVKKKDVNLYVKDGVLTLEAESSHEEKEEKEGRMIRQERRYGKFMRTFNLGGDVKESDIKASFKDGILTLHAPKAKETVSTQRRITIN